MLRSVLLSSHSSVLMLNFQNFYITKGPTTSAEKYPASTKSVRQPRPRRGETRAFRQLSTDNRGELVQLSACRSGFSAAFWHFAPLFVPSAQKEREKEPYYFGETMSATFPGLVHDAEVGACIFPDFIEICEEKGRNVWGELELFWGSESFVLHERRTESELVGKTELFSLLLVANEARLRSD